MKLTEAALSNKVAVLVAIILVVIFGYISLNRLPIQMAPNVERPTINISTSWPGAAPEEIESEILELQENVFRGMPGVERMAATASYASASIDMEFGADVDMQRSLIEVINRLNQVPGYPVDANEPTLRIGGRNFGNAIAWFAIRPKPENKQSIVTYQDFVNDNFLPKLEQVNGVSSANSFGGRNYEVRISYDPYQAAALGVDLTQLGGVGGNFTNTSMGTKDVGKRKYTMRFESKYDYQALSDYVIDWREGQPIYLKDIATIDVVLQDPSGLILQNGGQSIAANIIPEAGVNLLDLMDNIKLKVSELQETTLDPAGLYITQVYDESIYTNGSVDMVRNNLILGMLLAIFILWAFLRKKTPALIVAVAIPICLMGAFILLDAFGRTLNIISLAGLAFATGMVLDAAIVVLENIVRHREMGKSADEAAKIGSQQVWGALLASTATTVAIFLPVVFLKDEAGQLFTDLALTISISVVFSLIVAITVLPAATVKFIHRSDFDDKHGQTWQSITDFLNRLTATRTQQISWVAALLIIPLTLAYFLRPPADYLPEGKRNFAFGGVQAPPGMSYQIAKEELAEVVAERMRPYYEGEKAPKVQSYFFGVFGGGGFMGFRMENDEDMGQMLGIVNSEILRGMPDTRGFAGRRGVFGGGSRTGRSINVDIQTENFDQLLIVGQLAYDKVEQMIPGVRLSTTPGLELGAPEINIKPNDRAIAEAGWSRNQLNTVLRSMGTGAFVGEYFDGNKRMNVVLRAEHWQTPEDLAATPLYTTNGDVVPLDQLTFIERTAGPTQILRVDRARTLTLQVTPPTDMPLESAIDLLKAELTPFVLERLSDGSSVSYRGTAEALDEALSSLSGSFLLAIIILYLLISAMFQSFKDALLVVTTLPMATVGGILGLRVLDGILRGFGDSSQSMDLLTMIGFVILLGLVVNNAILLVLRARDAEKLGMSTSDAVSNAVRLRLRPIFMSTFTSIFGMLPLLLMPGSGTELYRGLAAVIVGGMLISTLFTLVLLPSLLKLTGTNQQESQVATT
ncbi:efflux RND transporter permease subunit [Marinicella sp. S1101]|uniref:efflux RND transporter permease subunit n=1 Tax=Marinicella marina TaxID=2996016 RepID=UPI002260EE34|nr:efflux RND transporter permease subunit [Marinicella marina]MCX7552682.1 efflux RND transporter permease subunit [Marinicella marina]MDJ1139558.1 efflux RND transporter permease subunit [Marinicella marina]